MSAKNDYKTLVPSLKFRKKWVQCASSFADHDLVKQYIDCCTEKKTF